MVMMRVMTMIMMRLMMMMMMMGLMMSGYDNDEDDGCVPGSMIARPPPNTTFEMVACA